MSDLGGNKLNHSEKKRLKRDFLRRLLKTLLCLIMLNNLVFILWQKEPQETFDLGGLDDGDIKD
jgi:hypothetical protein